MDNTSNFKEPLPSSDYDKCSVIMGLAAGTLVTTPYSEKKIEEVNAGDLVLSGIGRDYTDFFKVDKVNAKLYRGSVLRITAHTFRNNRDYQICATPNHICFGSARSRQSFSDDSILLYAFTNYTSGKFRHSVGRKGADKEGKYNSEICSSLDYAEEAATKMSQSDGGVEIGRFSAFCYQHTFEFMPASNLKDGMLIPIVDNNRADAAGMASITNIIEEQYDGLVYALDVPEARNFAANGVLIHDSTSVQF